MLRSTHGHDTAHLMVFSAFCPRCRITQCLSSSICL